MKTLSIIVGLLFHCFVPHSAGLTEAQKRQINICVNSYVSAIELYSSGKGTDPVSLKSTLRSIVIDPATSLHINDLSSFNKVQSDLNDVSNEDFLDYLRIIDEDFNRNIDVQFIGTQIIDCVDASEGLVKVDKKISFGGVTKTFSEILLINLPQNENDGAQYKIAEVLSVANYKAENNSCGASLIINEDDIDLYEKKKAADAYFFEQKNYLAAENLYEYILAKDPRNLTVQKQILLCKQNLTRSDYFNRANNFYDRKEFLNAQYWYKKLLTEYPDDPEKQTINNKIEAARLGQIELNYENARTRADVALAADNFNDARYYYEQALLVKPGDRYAALKLEDAKIQDDRFAEQQINRAVMLAEQSSKYYGEYFRVLMKYEGYGNHTRLNDKQYYNMVLLLNSYDSRVMKAMNFTRRDCRLYCKIYCKKLNDRYYSVQDFNLKEDIRNLLDNVINQRNQN